MKRFFSVIFLIILSFSQSAQAQELPQEFLSSDESVTFNYPEDWFADDASLFGIPIAIVTNNKTLLQTTMLIAVEPHINSGDVMLVVWSSRTLELMGFTPEGEFADYAEFVLSDMESSVFFEQREATEEVTLGETAVLQTRVEATGYSGSMTFLNISDTYVLVTAFAPIDEYEDFSETIDLIIETITHTPSELVTFTNSDETLTFDHATDLVTLDFENGYIGLTTDISKMSTDAIAGELVMGVATTEGLSTMLAIAEPAFDEATLTTLAQFASNQGELGDIESLTIGEHEALQVNGLEEGVESLSILIDFEDEVVGIIVRAYPGELHDWDEMVDTLVNSIQIPE